MEEKKISEMTEKEILRQQLELIAEKSKSAEGLELQELTLAMSGIAYSIRCIPIEEISDEEEIHLQVNEIGGEEISVWRKINKSIEVQKKWNKIEAICLVGMLLITVLFLIYLL